MVSGVRAAAPRILRSRSLVKRYVGIGGKMVLEVGERRKVLLGGRYWISWISVRVNVWARVVKRVW